MNDLESQACIPSPLLPQGFNLHAHLPYGCNSTHIHHAMQDFLDFLALINPQLHHNNLPRLETLLMPANFSSIVGEFMVATLPKYCVSLVKNTFHNGHPDLLPAGRFTADAAQHTTEGIEVKASRYRRGWQGHNPEAVWMLIFIFDSNRPGDPAKGVAPRAFEFVEVVGAQLELEDWTFAGRSPTSRRTITASINTNGYAKLMANWIYRNLG